MKRISIVFVSALLILALTSCTGAPSSSAPKSSENGAMPTATPYFFPAAASTPAATPPLSAIECNWVLNVDSTITKKTSDGLVINYTLVLLAEKQGGTDEQGAYTGTAQLTATLDASQLSQEVLKVMGGFNIDVTASPLTFDVVAYSEEDYSDFDVKEDEVGLAPLVQYDSMSLVNAPFSGSGSLDVLVQGVQGEQGQAKTDFSGIAPIPMKIAIVGGQVIVTINSLGLSDSFMGMVVGTPVN